MCPYVTPKPKVMETPNWHAGWYSLRIFRKTNFELMTSLVTLEPYFRKMTPFLMTSKAAQIFYKGCFVKLKPLMLKSK